MAELLTEMILSTSLLEHKKCPPEAGKNFRV
jgi:hypothetical protein